MVNGLHFSVRLRLVPRASNGCCLQSRAYREYIQCVHSVGASIYLLFITATSCHTYVQCQHLGPNSGLFQMRNEVENFRFGFLGLVNVLKFHFGKFWPIPWSSHSTIFCPWFCWCSLQKKKKTKKSFFVKRKKNGRIVSWRNRRISRNF